MRAWLGPSGFQKKAEQPKTTKEKNDGSLQYAWYIVVE
jgi:hypothetical protein